MSDTPKLPPLRPDMTVRLVAQDYPGCREVFLRRGEPDDRPTKFGHLEPLDRFAARHEIELDRLLAELAQAAGVGVDRESVWLQTVHRPFLAWALVCTLSLGAGWGAILLFEIGSLRRFDAVSAADVVAHGVAQLWGFIGLFVVGVALRFLPLTASGPQPRRGFCRLMLIAFLTGTIGGFVWSMASRRLTWLGPISGAALVLASMLFCGFVIRQVAGKLRLTWARLILAAGVWLVIWAVTTLVLRSRFAVEGPGAYSEPDRQLFMELAIFGFSMNAIYGFGLRLLPGMVGSATPRGGLIEAAFWCQNAGIALLVAGHWTTFVLAIALGVAALVAGAFCYAFGMRGFLRRRRRWQRPEIGEGVLERYVQVAFFWLLAALVLLLAAALAWSVRGLTPPHAYLGAVRHALTVGFMTTLILGVGQRLLPILGHRILPWPRLVLPIFLLIAIGNFWRVTTEFAAATIPAAFVLMPLSVVLEFTALTLFAANALRTLWPAPDDFLRTGRVTATTSVSRLLAEHSWLEDHLFAWGLHYVGRVRSAPQELTLGSLATSEGKAPDEIIGRINELLEHRRASSVSATDP